MIDFIGHFGGTGVSQQKLAKIILKHIWNVPRSFILINGYQLQDDQMTLNVLPKGRT